MRKFHFVIVFLFASTLFVAAQDKLTPKQQQIQRTVIDMFQAIADRDLDQLRYHCTSDILILESGIVWNLDTLVQKISQNKAPDFKRMNTFQFIDTKVNGKIAWTTYHNQAEVTRNGRNVTIKWLETAILIKEKSRWKIKNLHSTLVNKQ